MRKIKRKIKFAWQKLTRGFSDDELWNLDVTIAAFIAPRLRRFIEVNYSHPGIYTAGEWDRKLSEMVWAFELIASDVDEFDLSDDERIAFRKALRSFGEQFRNLWS